MVKIAKKEIEALSAAVDYFEREGLPLSVSLRSLLGKIDAKAKTSEDEKGLSPAKIENCLVMYSAGKVVSITGARNIFWIKQYQQWKALGPTIEQVETVAKWLARQNWMSTASLTIDQVAFKWPSFLAKATHDAAERAKYPSQGTRKEFEGE